MQTQFNNNPYGQYDNCYTVNNYYTVNGYMYPCYHNPQENVPYYEQSGSSTYYQDDQQPEYQDSQEFHGTNYYNQGSTSYLPPVPLFVPYYGGPYMPYYGNMPVQAEDEGQGEYEIPYSNNFETTSSKVDELVTEKDFFEDSYLEQGRVGLSMPTLSIALDYKKALLKKPVVQVHENGIFGAYCLEDVKCIATLVLEKTSARLTYDCFNYETISEITTNKEIIHSLHAPSDHLHMYYQNKGQLSELQQKDLLSYELHYSAKRNDLLQGRKAKIEASKDWEKFNRIFKQNMIFFNPYSETAKEATALMDAFFDYARTNLNDNGVVTIMWNPNRKDHLANVKIAEIAKQRGFKIVKKLSGAKFAEDTGFRHLKNSKSLNRAVSTANRTHSSSKVTVDAKDTDTIIMFKKKKSSPDIPASNIVATELAKFPEIEIYVK